MTSRALRLAAVLTVVTGVGRAHAQEIVTPLEPLPQASAPLAAAPIAASIVTETTRLAAEPDADDQTPRQRATAYEYSDAYLTRAKIHKVASFATLPLVGAEWALGQYLYNDPQSQTSSAKTAHAVVATGLVGLFALNSVTGVWNLVDGWDNPQGRTKRLIHGILMLTADAGFVASVASAPGGRNQVNFDTNKATHRNIAIFSLSAATAGYLIMLIGGGGH